MPFGAKPKPIPAFVPELFPLEPGQTPPEALMASAYRAWHLSLMDNAAAIHRVHLRRQPRGANSQPPSEGTAASVLRGTIVQESRGPGQRRRAQATAPPAAAPTRKEERSGAASASPP